MLVSFAEEKTGECVVCCHRCGAFLMESASTTSYMVCPECGARLVVCAKKGKVSVFDDTRSEEELQPIVYAWRQNNSSIVRFWWNIDSAVKKVVKDRQVQVVRGIQIYYQSGMLFIVLPSERRLAYVKPRIGENQFGGECITYEGTDGAKKWSRLDSYGPKFVENIVQATSRDILMHSMKILRDYRIVAHVHDEVIIEADPEVSLDDICEQMATVPKWAEGLPLRADGYVGDFYKKD